MQKASSLPPYLTSGASSRAHHAFLVQLNEAASLQEEDKIIADHIGKVKVLLGSKDQDMRKIAENLIILLHCGILRHDTNDDLNFALVPALQLAAGGRNLSEKRIGYLYLVERLPQDHELQLMLINTIRKDLASHIPAHVLLALHTIVKLPSRDLGPAVEPILVSKAFRRHGCSAIRQRAYECLNSLYFPDGMKAQFTPFPLSMRKLVDAVVYDSDLSVLRVIFVLLRRIIETDPHKIQDENERTYLIENLMDTITDENIVSCQFIVEALKLFKCLLLNGTVKSRTTDKLYEWIQEQINKLSSFEGCKGAFLLEICALSSVLPSIIPCCLEQISDIIHPPSFTSSHTVHQLPSANEHVLALRCLLLLPVKTWDGKLDEAGMGVIMEGVNSADGTIRRLTIRLLNTLSQDITRMILDGYLDSLKTSSNLSLPISIPQNLPDDDKLQLARRETAYRALEVLEVTQADGTVFATELVQIMGILENEEKDNVWDHGFKKTMEHIYHETSQFRDEFITSILESLNVFALDRKPGQMALMIACTVICEFPPSNEIEKGLAVTLLVDSLLSYSGSIQELILATLVSLLAETEEDVFKDRVKQAVKRTEESASIPKYLKKRCTDMLLLLDEKLLPKTIENAKSRSLSDVLASLIYTASWHRKQTSSLPLSSNLLSYRRMLACIENIQHKQRSIKYFSFTVA
ncbi:uncharacterized protein L203_104140 [Cryptococcus depauperatus CBS 7841]|uniref:Clathrin/coatomer adaptor adaptin-like N-terminal domain-containing protein n=1 Tax=Cryptococcus depauperatus CBS 7841 TaxID=1295531 RepID=A0AAJ8JUX0_9TREE